MPRKDLLRNKVKVILKALADTGKERVKDAAQGQNSWPRIDRPGRRGQGAHLAARTGVAFQHRDRQAGMRQPHSSSQPRDPGTDDYDSGARV